MKIFGSDDHIIKRTKVGQSGGGGDAKASDVKSKSSGESSKVGGENVQVSNRAKDVQKAREAVSASPDVRAEKVREIKEKVDSGEYHVNSDDIAQKIIESTINSV